MQGPSGTARPPRSSRPASAQPSARSSPFRRTWRTSGRTRSRCCGSRLSRRSYSPRSPTWPVEVRTRAAASTCVLDRLLTLLRGRQIWAEVEPVWVAHLPLIHRVVRLLGDTKLGIDTTHDKRRNAIYASAHAVSILLRLIVEAEVSDKRVAGCKSNVHETVATKALVQRLEPLVAAGKIPLDEVVNDEHQEVKAMLASLEPPPHTHTHVLVRWVASQCTSDVRPLSHQEELCLKENQKRARTATVLGPEGNRAAANDPAVRTPQGKVWVRYTDGDRRRELVSRARILAESEEIKGRASVSVVPNNQPFLRHIHDFWHKIIKVGPQFDEAGKFGKWTVGELVRWREAAAAVRNYLWDIVEGPC